MRSLDGRLDHSRRFLLGTGPGTEHAMKNLKRAERLDQPYSLKFVGDSPRLL